MVDSPNTLLTAEKIARTAAAIAGQDLGLGALVHRDLAAEFGGGSGATVKVRVPGAVKTNTRTPYSMDTLVTSAVVEQSIDVTLTEEAYNVVPLARGDLDLSIENHAAQVLRPQSQSVAKHAEKAIATAMSATTASTTITYDPAKPATAVVQARRVLRTNGVDANTPLLAVAGARVYADLLLAEAFDESGEKVHGVAVHENSRIAEDDLLVFVRDAFVLAVRGPVAPEGAPVSYSVSEEGFALTYVRAFDPSIGVDKSIVSAFIGAQAMPLAVDREDGTVDLVEGGGAVRVVAPAEGV